ncbi:BTAD domain-containing putative transcriptional regulator [Nonomuraea basaltis]|uniref:BTAD domain-containing putative transcriptional regulator n=1 Tax=Nonomuraea basaltis TaxID=2495887 RepID=UPI00110C6994|nr:BTAD domain-containing putative transcriptional regulator [Nonomuraea basaltis]TMR89726.1 tetratricopeptide repeat protein [Nonomuraea basaltis]
MEDLDVAVFLDLVGRARRAGQAGDDRGEADLLQRSLALWRGPALVDVPSASLHRDHVLVLNEQRVQALERWFDLGLRTGRYDEMIVELKAATAAHPLRERLWAQLMLALHRSGHQAEALQVYHTVGNLLRQELGVDPGGELRKLHHDILTGDPALLVPPALSSVATAPERLKIVTAQPSRAAVSVSPLSTAPPRQLPADIVHFTGRRAQLEKLRELLAASDGHALRPVLIGGTGGMGKTALAVHWAHMIQGRFPDGQLYLDLRGFGPGAPVEPAAALEMLLRALDVAPERLSTELDARSALLRTLLADRRMLILLDNARDEAQVRPLLPGAQSLVLITSRNQLRGLAAREGAFRITLDAFSPDETHSLLLALLNEECLRAAPQAETELGELCSRLPLALSIAAANLGANPHLSLTDYVSELREGNRLAALETGSDQAAAVRATFDLSYTALPDSQRRLFRLLGLLPGTDFTAAATAAVAGCSTAEARRELDRLATYHLIRPHSPGRYTFHDLLRLYAAEHAHSDEPPSELLEAQRRLYDWYLHSVLAAAQLLHPHWVRLPPPPLTSTVRPAAFDSQESAAAWLEAEHANLVAMIRHAHQHGPAEMVWRLTDALRGHFWVSRHLDDWLACAQAALTVAEAEGTRTAQAVIQLSLADAYTHQDRPGEAMEGYARALSLTEEIGWLDCQASALGGLSNAYLRLGHLLEAVEHLDRALELSRQTGRKRGQEAYLNNLANAHHLLGRLELALDHLNQALELTTNHSTALICTVGAVHHSLGRLDEAVQYLNEGVLLSRQRGDHGVELEGLVVLAAARRDLGHHAEAFELGGKALVMSHDLGDHLLRAGALNVVGTLHHDLGRYREALELHQQALDAAMQGGNRHSEVMSLIGLANAARGLGRYLDAATYAERAYAIARDRSFRMLQGLALTALAETSTARAAPSEAATQAKRALELHRATGHRLGEARALRVLGDALYEEESADAAVPCWREAVTLFSAVGSPEAAEVSSLINGVALGTRHSARG